MITLLAASASESYDVLPTIVYVIAVLIAAGLFTFGIRRSLRGRNDQDIK